MENVTKALLIAGGILFAVLILTLLVIFYNQLSSYYTEQNNAKMNEQVVEFNNKFENYNGQTIRGNELISVMNKVVDYNRTYSDIQGAERLTINVDLQGHQKDLLYTGTSSQDTLSSFKKATITNSNGNDSGLNEVAGLSTTLQAKYGLTDTELQKLSSEISVICNTSTNESDIKARDEKLKKILGSKYSTSKLNDYKKAAMQYYQLTQFKRAMFECTEMIHSSDSGRINKITFKVVIENNTIKLN